MRQDFFEYIPQFKLLFAGNHKPSLRNVDAATRRRFNLVPLTVTIPEGEKDSDLPEKLKQEWPEILRWAIEGCLEYQKIGLSPPEVVRDATDAYLEAQDSVAIWISECCKIGSGYALSEALFASWTGYCNRTGEYVGSQKRLSEKLEAMGLTPKRQGGTGKRGFEGITIVEA
jgi:putative DNA primase/helicase